MLGKYAPQLVHKLNLEFPILSDPGQLFLEQLRVVFSLPAELIEIYKGFGIDLERFNGDKIWRLPLPGQIIVDRDGLVQNVDLYVDHTQRPEPAETARRIACDARGASDRKGFEPHLRPADGGRPGARSVRNPTRTATLPVARRSPASPASRPIVETRGIRPMRN